MGGGFRLPYELCAVRDLSFVRAGVPPAVADAQIWAPEVTISVYEGNP